MAGRTEQTIVSAAREGHGLGEKRESEERKRGAHARRIDTWHEKLGWKRESERERERERERSTGFPYMVNLFIHEMLAAISGCARQMCGTVCMLIFRRNLLSGRLTMPDYEN